MHLHYEQKTTRLRDIRRAVLAASILAASSAIAAGPDDSATSSTQWLRVSVQSNPFCDTDQSKRLSDVQLASNANVPAIQLKPIGSAVGLRKIGEPTASDHRQDSAKVNIESVKSIIRSNPLVSSIHHDNTQLEDAEVVDHAVDHVARTDADQNSEARRSTIILRSNRPRVHLDPSLVNPEPIYRDPMADPTSPPTLRTRVELIEPVLRLSTDHNKRPPQAVRFSQTGQYAEQHRGSPVIEQPVTIRIPNEPKPKLAKPIERIVASRAIENENHAAVIASISSASTPSLERPSTETDPVFAALSDQSLDHSSRTIKRETTIPMEVDDEKLATSDLSAPSTESISVLAELSSDQHRQTEAIPIEEHLGSRRDSVPSPTPQESLHSKKYRPPVAIMAVPIAIEREQSDSPLISVVHAVDALTLVQTKNTKTSKLVPLYMKRAQVRSLRIGGNVRKVQVSDNSICKAVADGPNQLKLIGTGNGVTRLVVWAAPDGASSAIRSRTFEVHVSEAAEPTGESLSNRVALLNRTLRETFPASYVTIHQQGNQLVVSGECEDTSAARKIMRMIRKTCLVPAQDELVIR